MDWWRKGKVATVESLMDLGQSRDKTKTEGRSCRCGKKDLLVGVVEVAIAMANAFSE